MAPRAGIVRNRNEFARRASDFAPPRPALARRADPRPFRQPAARLQAAADPKRIEARASRIGSALSSPESRAFVPAGRLGMDFLESPTLPFQIIHGACSGAPDSAPFQAARPSRKFLTSCSLSRSQIFPCERHKNRGQFCRGRRNCGGFVRRYDCDTLSCGFFLDESENQP